MTKLILKFQSASCNPCKQLSKVIEETHIPPDVKIKEVQVDEDSALARKHKVRAVPTVIFFEDDVEVRRWVGAMSPLAWQNFAGYFPDREQLESN